MRNIKLLLQRWGAWASSGERRLGYASVASGFRGLITHHGGNRLQCSDGDGIILDSCISRLAMESKEQHDILVAHYLYLISLRSIARRRRCADGTIRKKLQTAEGFVCGVLTALECELECENT
ncbi:MULTISPECIES: antiterminator Q family protein [Erwinia]|uniref:Antitermination protein n=1 Tax=Erwinia pyrifoliae TaxID=79967 RepID=A0ABY5X3Q4_ERWPY|nr:MULTISPECIES: antiterminator Q family protein [Erwinia]AUX72428.1 antitermination protein [Erwinia pyrifoliae]MCA8877322.1 antitermination protein [Erwinia pyrifoliae]MCT2388732.1 antiterminator Q family protein [Erwinia pyrifoliae]MCU8586901.1 antiterminator Q family protein [Erwinia pyrifoliae]UWS30772.1 antitermination protein [Erwinia pyrifoliae]